MTSVRTLTLADLAVPRPRFAQQALLVVGASLATGLAARLAVPVPWSPVPITGQTFAVLLSGMVLGSSRAFLAQALYLAEGAAGLPVFAGGASAAALAGPTAGYLFAFPFAAALTGWLAERGGWDRSFAGTLAAMLLGSAVVFAGGLTWLARFVAPGRLFSAGLFPFIPGDIAKATLAALAFPAAWRVAGRVGPGNGRSEIDE